MVVDNHQADHTGGFLATTSQLQRDLWEGLEHDAVSALWVLREFGSDLPCLIVSGAISDEMAVSCMKAGADDYLLKDKFKVELEGGGHGQGWRSQVLIEKALYFGVVTERDLVILDQENDTPKGLG
jgi:CheY-like chemotaxis protein